MNRNTRAYTPTRTSEVTLILDKLLQQLTPRQNQCINNSRDYSISPIRDNQVHLKQIELQKQSIEILQSQIREKSIENEQLKQKQMIKQRSATGNKFLQNSYFENSNHSYLDTSISANTPKINRGGIDITQCDDFDANSAFGVFPTQMERDYEQKSIKSLLQQNRMLEEKNQKFKELIQLMENQFNTKIQSYQQKEQKLESKQSKDKEIKEILQIQQNMMHKTIKELEDKYQREILCLKEELIKYKEDITQKDLQLQEKMYQILAKEDTITQLKVKYLENLKQNITKNSQMCFNEVRKSLEDLLISKYNQSTFHEDKQQVGDIIIQDDNFTNKDLDLEDQINEDKGNQQQINDSKIVQQNIIEFSSDMTFQQEVSSQVIYQQLQIQENSQKDIQNQQQQDSILLQAKSDNETQNNSRISYVKNDSFQDKENENLPPPEIQQGEKNTQDKVFHEFFQDNQKMDLSKSTHSFDKIQRSMNQMKNVQNFIRVSQCQKPKDLSQNGFNNSVDLKQVMKNRGSNDYHQQSCQEFGNESILRNSINIIRQNYQDVSMKASLDRQQQLRMNKETQKNISENKHEIQNSLMGYGESKKMSNQQYLNDQLIQDSIHSQNMQEITEKYLDDKHFNNINNLKQNFQVSQNHFNKQDSYLNNSLYNETNYQCNQNMSCSQNQNNQSKSNSKLYTLKIEQASQWRDTYQNLYGKTPINKQKLKQQQMNN